MGRLRLGVLVSGSGTNLQAILGACGAGRLEAEVSVVVSNRRRAYALERARAAGVATEVVSHRSFSSREAFDAALVETLCRHGVECVVLAGFMRILTPAFLEAFPRRVVNIHPSLLPAFPGVDAQQQALDYGVRVSGCTVHLVDTGTDTGPIIAQAVGAGARRRRHRRAQGSDPRTGAPPAARGAAVDRRGADLGRGTAGAGGDRRRIALSSQS